MFPAAISVLPLKTNGRDSPPPNMKTIQALLLLLLATAVARADTPSFEGRIDLQTTEGRKTFTTTYYYKDGKMRVETTEGDEGGAMIMDFATKEMMMLMPSEKMYMVMNFGGHVGKAAKNSTPPVKTGRTETILGYECSEYTETEGKKVTEYWAAHGLGVFRAMMHGGPGGPPGGPSAWETEAMRDCLFPLRTIERLASGKVISKTEATAVEPGPQSESLFVPPKDYTKFEMPFGMGMR